MKRGESRRSHIIGRFKRHISRLRHRRGHGVHSPYIYNIVREVFMNRKAEVNKTPLYSALLNIGVKQRSVREIENLRHHCGFSTFVIDSRECADMAICTTSTSQEFVGEILKVAQQNGTTVVILSPYLTPRRGDMCSSIIATHTSTTLSRRGYLIVFNNHLPKQHFSL
ncbi:MAG: hypothetical protein SNG27_02090 [Rikenellaceae bacterium]